MFILKVLFREKTHMNLYKKNKQLLLFFLSFFLISCSNNVSNQLHNDEFTTFAFVTIKNKTDKQISDFSKYYIEKVDDCEPDANGFNVYRTGPNKAIFFERFSNDKAHAQHVKNVSPGGCLEEAFGKLNDHFITDSVFVFGPISDEHVQLLNNFPIKWVYIPEISGYSVANQSNIYNDKEMTSFVYMRANNKSDDEIAEFSKYYKDEVYKYESNTSLGWNFYKYGPNKIILLERYISDEGSKIHATNISPGGPLENEFPKFMDHFVIDSIQNYGFVSEEIKEIQSNFPIPFSYYSLIEGYSR